MRTLTIVLTLGILLLGCYALARGDEEEGPAPAPAPGPSPRVVALEKQVQILQKQVEYLLAREKALTDYALDHVIRGQGLEQMVKISIEQGFTKGAFPWPSRETLMKGLSAFGAALRKDVPFVDKDQERILKEVRRLK